MVAGDSGAARITGWIFCGDPITPRRHNGSMNLVIERRTIGATEAFDARLHPVLLRAYAARGVLGNTDLALGLDRLVPVGTLDSIEAAVGLILEHRERRILVVGDFDADGATSTA